MKDLIIKKEGDSNKIVLTENGRIIEQYEQNSYKKRLEGNIYIGIVEDVLEGMQAAFVNIGEEKKAFIHVREILPKESNVTGNKNKSFDNISIKKYIKKGQSLVVQVKKDCLEKKGARISTELNIPGKFVVLIPNAHFITISQKIDGEERERLLNIVKKCDIGNNAIIVRTSAQGKTEEKINDDIKKVLKEYQKIEKNIQNQDFKQPKLIYENSDLVEKTITDIAYQDLDRIITNDQEMYNKINSTLTRLDLENGKIEVQLKDEDIFQMYDIQTQLENTKRNKIWLKCGGFITIDKTEALVAIDVNSGKYIGKENFEQTVLKVNSEATIEIAKQLKLRDIGGIIIIDYIDMQKKETREKILEILQEELKKDRAKTQIVGFTKLDLLEVTRKHINSSI